MSYGYAIAVTHLAPDLSGEVATDASDEDIAVFASVLTVLPFDLRRRMFGGLPWILACTDSATDAQQRTAELRTRGYGAVHVNGDELGIVTPKDKSVLSFTDNSLLIEPANARVELDRVKFILVASHNHEHTTPVIEKVYQGSVRGVPIYEEIAHNEYERHVSRAVYICTDFAEPVLCLSQAHVRIPSIPALTSYERMTRFVEALAARCPFAKLDQTLVHNPRPKRELLDMGTHSRPHDTVMGNIFACDLSARVLLTAYQEGQ
jgi:hypothetical protein